MWRVSRPKRRRGKDTEERLKHENERLRRELAERALARAKAPSDTGMMKTSLDHLPVGKQRELAFVVQVLKEAFAQEISTRWSKHLKDGQILTNYHVIQDAERILVKFADGRSLPARVLGTDSETDIALIKVDATAQAFIGLEGHSWSNLGTIQLASGGELHLDGIFSMASLGTVTNSGALATLTLPSGPFFSGTMNGALAVNFVNGAFLQFATLQYTGNTVIGAGQTVRNNGGTFDFTTDAGISGSGAGATFINGGLFEKTGGTGTSVV